MENESNKIASNTVVQIIGRVFVLALSLISIKLVTNYLGPEGTGFYNTIITYFSFAIVIADFGLFSVAVREVSKDPSQKKKLLSNIFAIRFISAIAITLLAVLVGLFTHYPNEIKYGIAIAALFPIFNLAGSVYDMLFQYKLEMQKVVWAELISKFITVILMFIIIANHLGYYAIIFTISFAAVLNFLIKVYLSKKELPFQIRYDRDVIDPIVKMALPLGAVFIVNNIYFKIDTLILFFYKGAVDVGIYAVSYRVLETTLFAGSFLSSSLKPLFSISIEKNKEKAERALSQAIVFLLFMALVIAIICVTFPKEIILFLSNKEFLGGSNALIILGLASILIYVGGIFGEVLIARDMRKTLVKTSIFILLFNIALNIFLIPRYSYIGAAYATLISEMVLITISYTITKRVVDVRLDLLRIFKLFFIAALASLLGFFIKESGVYFLANILIISLFYLLCSYFFNAIPKDKVDSYLNSLKKKWSK